MGTRDRLSEDEARSRLTGLPGWSIVDGKLRRELRFDDFRAAFSFMTRIALVAERMDHHPSWTNVYNRVTIELDTHDAGGLTELDFELAAAISLAHG